MQLGMKTADAESFNGVKITGAEGNEKTQFRTGESLSVTVLAEPARLNFVNVSGMIKGDGWEIELEKKKYKAWEEIDSPTWKKALPLDMTGGATIEVNYSGSRDGKFQDSSNITIIPSEAKYTGSHICGSCHEDNYSGWKTSRHFPAIGCEICHGPGGKHINSLSMDDINLKIFGACYNNCHSRYSPDGLKASGGFITPLQQAYEIDNSVHAGNVDCVTCHNPHYSPSTDRKNAIKIGCSQCHVSKKVSLGMEQLDCEDCHMPGAVFISGSEGSGVHREGDGHAHIFRIKSVADPEDMFSNGGSVVSEDLKGLFLTLNFACLGCHDGSDEFMLDMKSSRKVHQLIHR